MIAGNVWKSLNRLPILTNIPPINEINNIIQNK